MVRPTFLESLMVWFCRSFSPGRRFSFVGGAQLTIELPRLTFAEHCRSWFCRSFFPDRRSSLPIVVSLSSVFFALFCSTKSKLEVFCECRTLRRSRQKANFAVLLSDFLATIFDKVVARHLHDTVWSSNGERILVYVSRTCVAFDIWCVSNFDPQDSNISYCTVVA